MNAEPVRPWLAAQEGYYGPPLQPAQRADLIGWLAGVGFDGFVYSPRMIRTTATVGVSRTRTLTSTTSPRSARRARRPASTSRCRSRRGSTGVVLSPHVDVEMARGLRDRLGRPLWFAENFPVNDLGMSDVAHLGPHPARDRALAGVFAGVTVNMMQFPLASRIGLGVAARFWHGGDDDREASWRAVIDAECPALTPLAMACRSWLGDHVDDPELSEWVRATLAGGSARYP